LEIAKYLEIKTAAGLSAAFLSPKSDGLKECFPDTRLNGESKLEFLLPATSSKIAELTPECQIWAGGRVYTLLQDEAVDVVRDKSNKLWAKFMAVERWAELDSSFVEPSLSNDPLSPIPSDLAVIIVGGGSNLSGGLYTVGSAAHALYAVLQGSGWSMGTVDVTGTHDLEMEKVSRLQLIKEIQNIWGGYLVWDSVNKIVHLRDANTWQNYTGFQIRYRKNLQHITRTQSNKLVTKLYAFGHDDLDIASVNGGVKYLTNNSFSPRVHVGIYKNQDIYNAQELKDKAAAELSLICKPRYLYKTKMADLRTLPEYSHEDFAVGDMADVIDPDVAPDSPRVRIIRHKYNLFQPWKCEVEIGDPQERFIEQLKASFNTSGFVDSKYNGNGQNSGYSIEDLTIENAKIKNLSADKIIANTLMANVNMIIGSGNNVFKASYLGIHLGHADFALAPFAVDMYGNLYASSATIQGDISGSTITGSTFTAGTINVDTDVNIGNNLRLGTMGSTSIKRIYFNDGAQIFNFLDWTGNPPTGLGISASTINLDAGDITGIEWGHIEANPFGGWNPSDFEPSFTDTKYIKNYETSDNISISATQYGLIVRDGSTILGQIDYTVIGG
jgi:hypothetical protein